MEHKAEREAELFLRAGRGDEAAFREIFELYVKAMVNYAYRYLGNWHEAEEAGQEIFLRLHRAAPRYEPRAKFSTFIYHVATNVLRNWHRDHPRREGESTFGDQAPGPGRERDPEGDLDRQALLARVAGELPRLPAREREALLLVAVEGFSYGEAAAVMKTSFRAVKSLVHRARAHLREALPERGELNQTGPTGPTP